MFLGPRQLFVYWHCAKSDLASALPALRHVHADLRAQYPLLRAQLFVRNELGIDAQATVMEAYAVRHASGLDSVLQIRVLGAAMQASKHWALGERHVEVFNEVTA